MARKSRKRRGGSGIGNRIGNFFRGSKKNTAQAAAQAAAEDAARNDIQERYVERRAAAGQAVGGRRRSRRRRSRRKKTHKWRRRRRRRGGDPLPKIHKLSSEDKKHLNRAADKINEIIEREGSWQKADPENVASRVATIFQHSPPGTTQRQLPFNTPHHSARTSPSHSIGGGRRRRSRRRHRTRRRRGGNQTMSFSGRNNLASGQAAVNLAAARKPAFFKPTGAPTKPRPHSLTGPQLREKDQKRRLQDETDKLNRSTWMGYLTTPDLWFSSRGKTGGRRWRTRKRRRRQRGGNQMRRQMKMAPPKYSRHP